MKAFLAGLSLILLLVGGFARADWRDHPSYPMFRSVLEGDLHANSDARLDRASAKLMQEWEKSGDCGCRGELPGMFMIGTTDGVIVQSFEILGVQELASDKAVWRVGYEVVATSAPGEYGYRLDIFPAPRREIVEYPLVFEGAWVFESFDSPRILVQPAIEQMQEWLKSEKDSAYYLQAQTPAAKYGLARYEFLDQLRLLSPR